jgi:hypothetical protein
VSRPVIVVVLSLISATARAGEPCDEAREHLKRRDLVRASILAAACEDSGDERAAALLAEVEKKATARGMSPVEIITDPPGGTVVVEPASDLPFATPRRVWLPEGRHQVTGLVNGDPVATALVIAKEGNRAVALIELPAPPPPPGTGSVDFGEEGGGEMSSGPPPKVELPSLLPDRYLRGVNATAAPGEAGGRRRDVWTISLGPVVGAVTGDGGAAYGAGLAIVHRFDVTSRVAVVPEAIAQVLSAPDAMGERASVVGVHGDAALQLSTALGARTRGALGAGPSFSIDRGPDALDGVTLGVAAAVELERDRRHVLALRVEVPLWTGADQRVIGAGLFLGRRW